jgi:beta-barrel assembly-enhancing protease
MATRRRLRSPTEMARGESVASRGSNFPCFQQAGAVVGFCSDLRPAASIRSPHPSLPGTLHISETTFTAPNSTRRGVNAEAAYPSSATRGRCPSQHKATRFTCYAVAILVCSSVLCQAMCASDGDGTGNANNEAPSAASTTPPTPVPDVKPPKSDKYDVDRIGQRNISRGMNVYSLERERAMGQAMAAVVDRGTTFVADPEITDYVTRLAQNLARHSDAEVPFTIRVIDSTNRRVFALPGGFLYVDKGLLADVDNEAELAALMAHEIAHVAARHATRFATRKHVWNMLSIPIVWASGPAAIGAQQIGPLNLKKFARDAELEADLLGIQYQYAAGYDPQAFIEALEKLSGLENQRRDKASSGKAPLRTQIARAFASYPPTDERIQKIQSEIVNFLPGRNDYILDTSAFQQVKARLGDRPVLRRNRSADTLANGPVLRRAPSLQSGSQTFADGPWAITKGQLPLAFSYLSAPRH